MLAFDPGHFGISRQEARLMDPQQRHLLMCAVQALAHAGIGRPGDAAEQGRRVGLVASCGENTYFQSMLREADPAQLPDGFQLALHSDKDFLATKVAYHLGLTGPALTVQAACASSLVGAHLAAGMLRQGDSDVMLVGGVLVDPLLSGGYTYRPQHIFSPDGHCRPFSDDAGGTIGGSGVGVVVLKPLRQARADGDTIYSVITGSAINNDGSAKLSYSAPALAGQREVIRAALRRSGRGSDELGYVEAHGTGTRLGDPVEVGALRQAYDLADSGQVALASVKSQIGHLGAAAGVVGLIRATFAVYHGLIPPNVDFARLNPELGPDPAPFYIPTEARPWPADRPRVAAVSSFGIGGTNSHLVLEGPDLASAAVPDPASTAVPDPASTAVRDPASTAVRDPASTAVRDTERSPGRPVDITHGLTAAVPLLMLSSSSAGALRADADRIADYLAAHPDRYPAVLRHLQAGRPAYRWRMATSCADPAAAVSWLRSAGAVLIPAEATDELDGSGSAPATGVDELATGWLGGTGLRWPAGPAQPPWDFPPPAFELSDFDFPRPAPDVPAVERLASDRWLHQPHWARWRRAGTTPPIRTSRLLVVLTAEPLPPDAALALAAGHSRVLRVSTGPAFAVLGEDAYQVDPADPGSLAQLLKELDLDSASAEGIDWLHALPLAVTGPVGAERAGPRPLGLPGRPGRPAAGSGRPAGCRPAGLVAVLPGPAGGRCRRAAGERPAGRHLRGGAAGAAGDRPVARPAGGRPGRLGGTAGHPARRDRRTRHSSAPAGAPAGLLVAAGHCCRWPSRSPPSGRPLTWWSTAGSTWCWAAPVASAAASRPGCSARPTAGCCCCPASRSCRRPWRSRPTGSSWYRPTWPANRSRRCWTGSPAGCPGWTGWCTPPASRPGR